MVILAGGFELALLLGALVLFIPAAFFLAECLAAPRRIPPPLRHASSLPRTTLLIPAHNEEAGIAATLASVSAASFPLLEIVVIADNCTDATAAIARQRGVRVIERTDPTHLGKGYALAFGVECLNPNPPALVIVLDADCVVNQDSLLQLTSCAIKTGRPVQSCYTLRHSADTSAKTAISTFAFLVKNRVRPSGLARLGGPCLLTGSGMAFPWSAISELPLASGHLSEDMWWSVLLTTKGRAPYFCGSAFVYGEPPRRERALKSQRTRWERGHLTTLLQGIPLLFRATLSGFKPEPLWLALELSVPPLALLVLLILLVLGVTAVGVLLGTGAAPLVIAWLDFALVFWGTLVAWYKFGRMHLPARTLLAIPAYILWKIPLYLNTLLRTRVPWARTGRDPFPGGES